MNAAPNHPPAVVSRPGRFLGIDVGAALHQWRAGKIDAVVNVGPLECMPSKVAEAQFFHVAQREGLPALTLALNGEPLNPEVLDNFAYEVKQRLAHAAKTAEVADGGRFTRPRAAR